MSTLRRGLRRHCRSVAILVLGLCGLLMPATAAMSLAQPGAATLSAAAPAEAAFAAAPAKPRARAYHQPGRYGSEGSPGSASGAYGFWMLGGLSLMLFAGALTPGTAARPGRDQRR